MKLPKKARVKEQEEFIEKQLKAMTPEKSNIPRSVKVQFPHIIKKKTVLFPHVKS
jgi:hypothetical protein